MSVTLAEAKAQLRVRHDEQNDYISLLINAARSAIERYTGENFDEGLDDLKAAQLLYIEYLFYPPEKFEMDEATGWPLSVSALARPYRLPTLA